MHETLIKILVGSGNKYQVARYEGTKPMLCL